MIRQPTYEIAQQKETNTKTRFRQKLKNANRTFLEAVVGLFGVIMPTYQKMLWELNALSFGVIMPTYQKNALSFGAGNYLHKGPVRSALWGLRKVAPESIL